MPSPVPPRPASPPAAPARVWRHEELSELLAGLTRCLAMTLDAKDTYTYGHSERVARIAVELGRELGLGEDELADLFLAGLLHDVGKIGIKDTVLHKGGPLTGEEQEYLRQHVMIGYWIVSEVKQLHRVLPGVFYHHERWDGRGYPDGLAGEAIPLLARVLAVADAYDAMSHPRSYRAALAPDRVGRILTEGAGRQWDARVVDALFRCRHRLAAIDVDDAGESLRRAVVGTLRTDSASQPAPHDPRRPPALASGAPSALTESRRSRGPAT